MAGISKITLDKQMEVRYYARYNINGYTIYRYWKSIKIGILDLDNRIDMDYWKLVQIRSNITFNNKIISNSYNSRRELVFY